MAPVSLSLSRPCQSTGSSDFLFFNLKAKNILENKQIVKWVMIHLCVSVQAMLLCHLMDLFPRQEELKRTKMADHEDEEATAYVRKLVEVGRGNELTMKEYDETAHKYDEVINVLSMGLLTDALSLLPRPLPIVTFI